MFVIDNTENIRRRSEGKKSLFSDDCGVWDSKRGSSSRSYFIVHTGMRLNSVSVSSTSGRTGTSSILFRLKGYRRRVSWIECITGGNDAALIEYEGRYPFITSSNGNSVTHQDDDYVCKNPKTLEKISKMSKYQTPRDVYKTLTAEDSFNGPRDFKQ